MARTPDNRMVPDGIIPREPPPPGRQPAEPIEPDAPTEPARPSRPPIEAPRQAGAHGPASSRRGGRRSGDGADLDPIIIGRSRTQPHAATPPRAHMSSAPALALLDWR